MAKQKKIIIFTSNEFGLKIFNYLKKQKNYKSYLIVSKNNKALIEKIKKINIPIFKYFEDLNERKNFLEFKNHDFDLLISAYFNKIFSEKIYNSVKKTINFHPSYLPNHKGCYPHVHSMITGVGCGITFHEINKDIDSGNIWFQKKVKPYLRDNQDTFHNRLKREILKEFKKIVKLILYNKVKPKKQSSKGNYNKRKSLDKLDQLFLNKKYKLKDLIILLNARTSNSKIFSYFKLKNKKNYIKIELS